MALKLNMTYDRNKPFNELPGLPPLKDVSENPQVLKMLVTASRALATIDGHVKRLPNPQMLINTIALQEAKSSTEIENIFTTDDELYRAISNEKNLNKIKPETKEVLRYRESLWAGYEILKHNNQIDQRLIIDTFRAIKKTDEGIRPPQSQTVIRRGNSELRPGEIIYTPPRGEGILESMLDNLVHYLNTNDDTDPLIKMAISHYQFESIHPFRDGNGRTGRILNLLSLVNNGLLSAPTIYMSKHIIATKEEYYYQLGAARQNQDFAPWVLYMLEVVQQTSIQTGQLIENILSQMEETLIYGKSKLKWYSKEINELIFTQPYTRSEHLAKLLERSSRTTITKYMNELVASKILRPQKNWKEVFYVNDDLVSLLEA